MGRPIIFDCAHLIVRQHAVTPTGIDRVDHAYAAALAENGHMFAGINCVLPWPRLHRPKVVAEYAARLSDKWGEQRDLEQDFVFNLFRGFVTAPEGKIWPAGPAPEHQDNLTRTSPKLWQWMQTGLRLTKHDRSLALPEGALFLNVTQNPTLLPLAARFLQRRPDLKSVFLIHDLIPVDRPDFFPPSRGAEFSRTLDVMFRFASAFITTTEVVKSRILKEMRHRSISPVPIHVAPLPVAPGFETPPSFEPRLAESRYVVMVGTVEPRKNHWLILNLWLRMVRNHDNPPRLVIIGNIGWGSDWVTDFLNRAPGLSSYVLHLAGLSNEGLRRAISHARALLMPSFSEGYGLPVIEGSTLGTPVIASDLPVFSEISQNTCFQVDPLDGPAWRSTILELAGAGSAARKPPMRSNFGFLPPISDSYFSGVTNFLANI